LNEIKADGYNTIRLPYSNAMIENPIVPQNLSFSNSSGQPINTALKGKNAFQDMVIIVDYATKIGLKVILDQHRSNAGNSASSNGLWYNSTYTTQNWINDWVLLAKTFDGNTGVIGADLHNEPHTPAGDTYSQGAMWNNPLTDTSVNNWPYAAEQAGNAILAVNPHWLIFVEGIGENPTTSASQIPTGENASSNMNTTWWGGDLELAGQYPVVLSTPNQLVYSAHDYGPSLYQQTWFNSSTTSASLDAVWNLEWGYLYAKDIAPIWVGEFGTDNTSTDIQSTTAGSQGQWFSSLVSYIGSNPGMNWTYWAANGEDSYALLNSNYNGIASTQKQALLQTIQFPLPGAASSPGIGDSVTTGVTGSSGSSGTNSGVTTTTAAPTNSGVTTTTAAPTTTTAAPVTGNGTCSATMTISSQWAGGFTANVTVTAGSSALSSWQTSFNLPSGAAITNSWSATITTSGSSVTAANESYNGSLGAGQSTSFGFQGTDSGTVSPASVSCS
jgi:endoglucanase